jgi:hypothetical protein
VPVRRSPPRFRRRGAAAVEETEEERQAKLAAMMADAQEFSKDRVERVQRHRAEIAAEDGQSKKSAEFLGYV